MLISVVTLIKLINYYHPVHVSYIHTINHYYYYIRLVWSRHKNILSYQLVQVNVIV